MNALFFAPACVTCIGQDGQITTIAANGAVYVMFAALALVFTCIIAVVLTFARRAKRHAALSDGEIS
jgi:hypothetical protein